MQAMREGKLVRRRAWPPRSHCRIAANGDVLDHLDNTMFTAERVPDMTSSIVSTDWEILS